MALSRKIESLWTHLHWLNVLAQQGSYTAAAARLGVSKASMSQRIVELEQAAGLSLVQRTTRSVRLTEAGQRLVDDTRVSFEEIATSFANVRDSAGQARGTLRVTAPVAFARQQLVPRIAEFLAANPAITLQLTMSDRLMALATEGFDLAIRHSTSIPETHVAWTLCSTESVLVATKAYLRRRGTPRLPKDLTSHDCLYYPRAQDAAAWTFERAGRRKGAGAPVTVPISGAFAANNSEALRDAALNDLGIALVPDFTAQSYLRSGVLQRLLPDWHPIGVFAPRLHVVRPYASHVPKAVALFVSFLRKTFDEGFAA